MIDTFFIFSAVYLIALPPVVGAFCFFVRPPEDKKLALYFFILTALFSGVLGLVTSFFFQNPRPFVSDGIISLIPHEDTNGFPSRHTLSAAYIAAALFPFYKRTSIFLWVVALLIGSARVYTGVHHTVDILGSIVIAAASAGLAWVVLGKFLKN